MKYPFKLFPSLLLGQILFCTCDTIDYTLNNTVSLTCGFYSNGKNIEITDVLTVTAAGTDSVLINQIAGVSSISIPLSYWNDVDSIVLTVNGESGEISDTIRVEKASTPHFESPDCPSTMFHKIRNISFSGIFIDSISISQSSVNYDQIENIQIHL